MTDPQFYDVGAGLRLQDLKDNGDVRDSAWNRDSNGYPSAALGAFLHAHADTIEAVVRHFSERTIGATIPQLRHQVTDYTKRQRCSRPCRSTRAQERTPNRGTYPAWRFGGGSRGCCLLWVLASRSPFRRSRPDCDRESQSQN